MDLDEGLGHHQEPAYEVVSAEHDEDVHYLVK